MPFVKNGKLYQLANTVRKYYKYDYQNWTQPVFSSNNNTTSGISYTISASHEKQPAWHAFNGDTSTGDNCWWTNHGSTSESSPCWIQLKASKKIKMSKVVLRNEHSSAENFKTGYVQVSNNGTSWTNVATINGTNTASHETSVNISVNEGYYYYRLYFVAAFSSEGVSIQTINYTGKIPETVETTEEQAEWHTDNLVSYSPIVRGKRTYYKQDLSKRDTGTYTFTLNKDYTAKMLFVGNGGGGGSSQNDSKWRNTSGGSGACFQGKVRLPKGTYTLTIGTLGYGQNSNNTANMTLGEDSTDSFLKDSSGKELIRVGCGARGTVIGTGGAGGVLKLGTLEVLETIKAVNGNQGDAFGPNGGSGKQVFALSAYDGTTTGYGAGTSSHRTGGVQYTVYGVAGIFDLALETDINNYTYYEDVGTKIY